MNRKKVLIIVGVILLIVAIIAIIVKTTTPKEDPKQAYLKSAIQTTIDKDTGAKITSDPNLGPQSEEARSVTILGMEPVIKAGALGEQVDFIKDAINTFSEKQLKSKYKTITIRPQDLVTTDGVTLTSIRLGQSDEILPITITAKNTGETQVVVDDPENKYGGKYDSGLNVFSAD